MHRNFTTHFNSEHTAESANKLENIKAGFPSTRTMETINAKYIELQQHPMVLKGKPYLSVPPDVRNGSTGPSAGRGIFFFISVFSDHADLQASNFWQSEEILSIISGASKLIYLVYLTIGTFYYKEIHLQTSLLLTELLKNYCYTRDTNDTSFQSYCEKSGSFNSKYILHSMFVPL